MPRRRQESGSATRLGPAVEVDVAAAEDHADVGGEVVAVVAEADQAGQGDGAAGLHHLLGVRTARRRIASTISSSVTVTTCTPCAWRIARVVSLSWATRPSAIVSPAPSSTRWPAARERKASSTAARLGAPHRHRRVDAVGGDGRARQEPAAAHRGDDHADGRHRLQQLEGGGALAGLHPRVVEGVDLHRARVGHQLGDRLGARLHGRLALDDAAAFGLRGRDLRGRRAARDHDRARDAARRRRARRAPTAWLPELWATTPRAASSSDSCSTALVAPRSLKAPVAWRCSALRCTRVPAHASMAADRSTGVGGTSGAMRAAAARTSSNDGPGVTPAWRSWWSGR